MGAHAVTKVGPELFGCGKGDPICSELVAFPKLEWLVINDMPNWKEWSFFDEVVAMREDGAVEIQKEDAQSAGLQLLPLLVKLQLIGCPPKLRALPPQLGEVTTSLKEILLIRMNKLKVVEDFPLLSELLTIENCEGLKKVSNLPQVTALRVGACPNLSHVEGLGSLQQLGMGEDMQGISTRWVPGLQEQQQRLHGEELDVYTWS
ncbi:unnamed protein product [Triticum turgidum subsp. durum]|uniref:Uncharacterized protein n=1 Tax=Triticum turgidum subsp. durum TaxID=4567 RepID=A0A9R0RAX0_TRITD|nr:unnamed protein product [Triticum turgidum subsp. durum]